MSTHPNVMLICALTVDNTARKTLRAIFAELGVEEDENGEANFNIGEDHYSAGVMESDYEEGYQIALPEGTIYVMNLATYGYGEKIGWNDLVAKRDALVAWAQGICERHSCSYEIFVGANYW